MILDPDHQTADELADDHEAFHAGHKAQVKPIPRPTDQKLQVYCLQCDWESWGVDAEW